MFKFLVGFQVGKIGYLSQSSCYHIFFITEACVSFILGVFTFQTIKSFLHVKFCFLIIGFDYFFTNLLFVVLQVPYYID